MKPIKLPCGSVAVFDHESGCSYRCTAGFATVGSIEMPCACAEELKKWDTLRLLSGTPWDFSLNETELQELY